MHINCLTGHYAEMSNGSCIQIYRYDSRSRWPLACWDCWFESCGGMNVCLLWMLGVVGCCQTEVSARGRSHAQRSPTECDVSVRDVETLIMRRPCCATGNKTTMVGQVVYM